MSVVALPKATEKLQNLGRLQDIPALRQLAAFVVLAAAVALGIWLFAFTQKPDYAPVFSDTDPKAQSEASQLLSQAGIPFRLEASGALAVPQEDVARARLQLASAGLPAKTQTGFETLNNDQGFGTSQFVESARYQHALETELARTIANLSPVREARVHLAIPKPSAFSRERQPSSASVVLNLKSGAALEQGQVAAIVHLVASSVPNMAPAAVTVVDQFGRMLSSTDPDSEESVSARQQEKQRKREAEYVQRIQELLEPMTGVGKVSTKVSVDMDFSEMEEAREVFGEPPKVRSEQLSEVGSAMGPNAGVQGVPGSATNTPDPVPTTPPQGSAAGGNGSRSTVRNYELDRTLTHTRQSPGRITRVTAAVLVDNIPGPPGKKGEPTTRPLTPAELENIRTLVQQSIGFDAQRGDVVSVVNAPFVATPIEPPAPTPIWEHPKADEYLRIVLGGLALLLLLWIVVRPSMNKLVGRKTAPAAVALVVDDEPEPQLSAPVAPEIPALTPPDEIPLTRTEVFDNNLDFARKSVASDPKRVAQVLRSMVADHG